MKKIRVNVLNLKMYMKAGVREYFIVDHDKEVVIVYSVSEEDGLVFPAIYDFNEVVPVKIWRGKCEVDFSQTDTRI